MIPNRAAPTDGPAVVSASPQDMRESRIRSMVKAISWRVIGTVDTMLWAWIITGRVKLSLLIGSAEALSKVGLFYLHERAWAAVPLGTMRRFFRRRPFAGAI